MLQRLLFPALAGAIAVGGAALVVRPQAPAARVTPRIPDVARPLPLNAVRLTDGPLRAAQDADARYLLSLEPDRMLAWPRQRAGLKPKAEPYGGWDGDGRNLTGHIAGHYLSAVSLMYAATGDVRFKARADYIVSELKAVQAASGNGYVGAIAGLPEAFAALSRGDIRPANFDLNGLWSPWYTLHKTYAGLRDAWRYTRNADALEVEQGFAAWAEGVLAPLDEAQIQTMLSAEFGGMNEVLVDLYADTGDERWLRLSYRFEHGAVMEPLARGEDILDGLHGNTQVPKVLGAAARYGLTGNAADGAAARTFWDRVVRHHTFATGGHGKDEYFRDPGRLAPIVDGRTAESCNVYNMLKLTRRLFALDPRPEYAEFMERALFNHVLASIEPTEGAMCYMVPVGRGVAREYQQMQRSFTCCVGTGMESHALHGDGLYFEAGDRLWVNVYAPSTAHWASAGVRLTMDTDMPEGDRATVRIATRTPRPFTLLLRRPAWADAGTSVQVNGEEVDPGVPGSFVAIDRTWRAGDVVHVRFARTLRLEPTPDLPTRAAIMWGPLVLAGDLGPEPARMHVPDSDEVDLEAASTAAPALVTDGRPPSAWLVPVEGRPGTFTTHGVTRRLTDAETTPAGDVTLTPFYRLHHRTYAGYWDLFDTASFEQAARQARADLEAQRTRQAWLTRATVSAVPIGDAAREPAFNPQGEGASIMRTEGRAGRRALRWFSYDLPVVDAPVALVLTFNTDNRKPRTFDVLVDGARLAREVMPKSSTSAFIDRQYALPPALVRGKERVTVRVGGAEGADMTTIFGVRIVRTDRD